MQCFFIAFWILIYTHLSLATDSLGAHQNIKDLQQDQRWNAEQPSATLDP